VATNLEHYTKARVVVRCAQCNKPVDRLHMEVCYLSDAMRFKVECHGETDNCEVPRWMFEDFGGAQLAEGVAFTTKRLTND
jgi:hypothetical protein